MSSRDVWGCGIEREIAGGSDEWRRVERETLRMRF